jgi:hypothetical protein
VWFFVVDNGDNFLTNLVYGQVRRIDVDRVVTALQLSDFLFAIDAIPGDDRFADGLKGSSFAFRHPPPGPFVRVGVKKDLDLRVGKDDGAHVATLDNDIQPAGNLLESAVDRDADFGDR